MLSAWPNPGSDVFARQLSIERMCQLAQVSRAGFYRSLQERLPVEKRWKLGPRFTRSYWSIGAAIAIAESLRNCDGAACSSTTNAFHDWCVKMILLAVQPRAFVVTTDSRHELEVYLNLARRMKLTGIINSGWPISLIFGSKQSLFTWPSSWMVSRARWWAGPWSERWPLGYPRPRWNRQLQNVNRHQVWSMIRIAASNTLRTNTWRFYKSTGWFRAWAGPRIRMTMQVVKALWKRSSVKRSMLTIMLISSICAATSRRSLTGTIIAAAYTQRSATNRRKSSSSNSNPL